MPSPNYQCVKPVSLESVTGTLTVNSLFDPVGSHTVNSSLATAQTLTPPAGTNALVISVEAQNVRLRMDGSDATATDGFLLKPDDFLTFQFADGVTFSVIELAATATIQYQWGTI